MYFFQVKLKAMRGCESQVTSLHEEGVRLSQRIDNPVELESKLKQFQEEWTKTLAKIGL